MKIDEENNTILASIIGAGRKNFEDPFLPHAGRNAGGKRTRDS